MENNKTTNHVHRYDKDGKQLCCTLEEKINQNASPKEAHDDHDGHDHDHTKGHSNFQLFLPALISFVLLMLAIASLLNTQSLTGSLGTKAAIVQKMPSARIIHLATHGIFDDVRGLGSAIALAPSGNDNGLLTAEEILDLKLNAELVVLSACDTGRGRITGDGIIGLSRSLISAGVPSVIVSLWSVPDAPTAELMTAFYQNWQKNPDKAQALRQAMLTMMKQYPNPKDWAAFTLIGEAE